MTIDMTFRALNPFLTAAIALALAVSASPAAAGSAEPEGTIVAMGDSLTEGYGVLEEEAWPSLLQEMLKEKGLRLKVVNAGVSGETSSGALSRIRWILRLKPDILILETGANDGLRGVDPAVTEKNIAQILTLLKEENITVVLAGMKMVVNMGKPYTDAFEKIYPSLAERFGVTLIPFFLDGVATIPTLNGADGIHPNAAGYRVLVRNLFPYVMDAIASWRKTSR
jgi:acyl-CoA thioesterase-1